MVSLLLIHGTGVREPEYSKFVERIRGRVGEVASGVQVHPCYWGDLGAELRLGGKSIPDYDSTRAAVVEPGDDDYATALWAVLAEDPLFELRMLQSEADELNMRRPDAASPGEVVQDGLAKLAPEGDLKRDLERAGLWDRFDSARQQVADSQPFLDAVQQGTGSVSTLAVPVARAVLATALASGQGSAQSDQVLFVPTRDQLEDLTARIAAELGTRERSDRGPSDWIKKKLSGFALSLVTNQLERKRGRISDSSAPGAGDILLYQARGTAIRDFIRGRIAQMPGQVVLHAHSLGGIACVDLLVESAPANVRSLVTIGSQAPFFYEINALCSLATGSELPASFPRWLNFFDPRDILSYVGNGVFPGRVRDVKLESHQPFPSSHGSYWAQDEFWRVFAEELRGA